MNMPMTLHCLRCGYNLTGVCFEQRPIGDCPECGERFEYEKLKSLPYISTLARLDDHTRFLITSTLAIHALALLGGIVLDSMIAATLVLRTGPVLMLIWILASFLASAAVVRSVFAEMKLSGWRPDWWVKEAIGLALLLGMTLLPIIGFMCLLVVML